MGEKERQRESTNLVFLRTLEEMEEGFLEVFRETRPEGILSSKLVSGLSHDRVDHVQTGHLVL